LPDGSYYAAAGWLRDGLEARVAREMAAALPGVTPPKFDGDGRADPAGAGAFALLRAAVTFPLPYFEADDDEDGAGAALSFKDADGRVTRVRGFGVRGKDAYAYRELRRQPRVLFAEGPFQPESFAIDLCRTSEPSQVIVARVARGATLGATVADVEYRIKAAVAERAMAESANPGLRRDPERDGLGINDVLLVPVVSFRVAHRFREVEGVRVAGPKGWGPIDLAEEVIAFRLDKGGMELAAQAKARMKPMPTHYLVDGPFLVYAKRRDAKRPYFAAWVENAELLAKRK
jgi:hypothetical protein